MSIKQPKYTKLLYISAEKYRCVFPFPYFNIVQTKVFDEVYDYGYVEKAKDIAMPVKYFFRPIKNKC